MKVKVQEDRKVYIIKGTDTNAVGTQNENNATELEIVVPEQYQDFNKKIVFITDDGVVWDIIENNTYKITNAITKHKSIKFYIWLTKDNQDFRSEEKTLTFNNNTNADKEITEEEIGGVNKVINLLESEITKVTGLENEVTELITDIQNKLDNGEFKGEKGEQGKSGVHVGDDMPTDDSIVWINLNGENDFDSFGEYAEQTKHEIFNSLIEQCATIEAKATSRCGYAEGDFLYHTGGSGCGVVKIDISDENNPTIVASLSGHSGYYPRGMAKFDKYLYIPYRENAAATATGTGTYGGYLDIINIETMKKIKAIGFNKEEDMYTGKSRYFGKSQFASVLSYTSGSVTYNYLCVTFQMGGWRLYDLKEQTIDGVAYGPENPKEIYYYDNRVECYLDNINSEGYFEFHQPVMYTATINKKLEVFLAIAGYDRDLINIYNITDPLSDMEEKNYTYPDGSTRTVQLKKPIYTCNLRKLWNGDSKALYLHTMGITIKYPYIYLSIAPYPKKQTDMENSMQGLAVVNVEDLSNVNVKLFKIPNSARTTSYEGEPSPGNIILGQRHIFLDNYNKGIILFDYEEPANPKYVDYLFTGSKNCSVCCSKAGKTFALSLTGTPITMYKGI